MPSTEEIKSAVLAEIDRHGDALIDVAKTILHNPEPGFREEKTSRLVAQKFRDFGIPFEEGIAITGLKGRLTSGNDGPTVGVFGELDSLRVKDHTYADPNTFAAHACGHHCQISMMLAVGIGLQAAGVMPELGGNVALLAVPAEEYIEIAYRDELRRQGKIEFLGGKPEFIRVGAMDDIDMAMMTHTSSQIEHGKFAYGGTNNGIVAKNIRFVGKASHAGGAPYDGINALNAAMIAMSAIHAQRETYRDQDTIRIHPIITQGGVAVSSVPADVHMETFVRGRSIEAFLAANQKVDCALRAGAMAVGGSVEITTLPGYLPLQNNNPMLKLYRDNASALVGANQLTELGHRTGSTDMGDISQIMPAIHPYVVAASGTGHGVDYVVQDYELAVLTSAKAMAMTVIDLLANEAQHARAIKENYQSPLNKSAYLSLMRGMHEEATYTE
jgi:amidohydrolase